MNIDYRETLPQIPTPPAGKRQMTVSLAAASALEYFQLVLQADDTWMFRDSKSVAIEYLVHMALGGELKDFEPRTRQPGRRKLLMPGEEERHMRPSLVRKIAEKIEERTSVAKATLEQIRKDYELAKELGER